MLTEPLPDDVVALPANRTRAFLPTLYAGAIIVAGLYYGRDLTVPLVLASLLAFVLAPACALLQQLRLPRVLSVLLVVMFTFAVLGGLGALVGHQAALLGKSLPTYGTTIAGKWEALVKKVGFIEQYTKDLKAQTSVDAPKNAPPLAKAFAMAEFGLEDASGLSIARTVALPILSPLATGGVVLVFLMFILLATEDLRDRLVRLVGRHDLHRTILAMNDAAGRLSRYFLFQLALNTSFGVVIGTGLWLAGLPNPLLWGILAALMRFIPFIGVFLAVVPPLLLAVAVVPGWSLALIVLALFGLAEMIMGQVVEPLIYGHSTGLSPLAVIVATAFWALLWGPIGLLIATPLTVCLVVVGKHVKPLAFLAVILGDQPPLEPSETFYQRALEGQAAALVPGARRQIAASALTDYYDKVALPGLALAQADLARDTLAFERLEAIHDQIKSVLGQIEGGSPAPTATVEEAWRDPGTILCIPGRGQLDDLAATMAVHALSQDGFGAQLKPNHILGVGRAMPPDAGRAKVCCLSILEDGSSVASVRYFISRLAKQAPDAAVVVGLWHARADSALLQSLREEGRDEHVVLSVGELQAFCRALSGRSLSREPVSPRS